MGVKTVKLTLNGQTYNLAQDASGGQWKATITAPATTSWNANDDHKYHGIVEVEDTAGNKTTASITEFAALGLRVLEKDPPTIATSYPTNSAYITNSKPTIKWTVEDTGSGGAFSTSVTIVEGSNTIVVTAKDSAGKTTTITRTVILDTKAPTITAVTLTPNPVDAGKTFIISVTVSDN